MKVLVVGDFHESQNGRMFYGITRKLVNGLVRNDCNVYAFSNREIARQSTLPGLKPLGRRVMNRRLLETVENFRPDMLLLCHADTIARSTLEQIRRRPATPRIALRNVDPLFIAKNIDNINRYGDLVDAIFVTTAGDALQQFSRPGNAVAFMPNPVDISMESHRAFDNAQPDHDVFYATRYTRFSERIEVCRRLREQLPDVRFDFRGFDGKPSVFGWQYGAALDACRMGLSLDKENGWYLYASARMAQYMGNGLLTFVDRSSRFDEIFTDEEVGFHSGFDELAALIRRYKDDDAAARHVAARGHARYHALFSATLVSRYIIDITMRRPLSHDYAWPTQTY